MEVNVINMSGIYERETFYKDVFRAAFLDMKDISGTNCMCDDMAKELLLSRLVAEKETIAACPGQLAYGVHYIDNGNYHYLSALYLSLVKEPFSLVVLDHHPDMQRPMFDILSCGGWVTDVLDKNAYVRDVHIIGADRKLISELDHEDVRRVKFYDIEDVFGEAGDAENAGELGISLPATEYPVYLSIDKDVIRREELITNWDQGDATVEQVLGMVKALLPKGILGVDICGECAPDQENCDLDKAIALSDDFNRKIMKYLLESTCDEEK